jgi:probable rRNA maturation factor
MARSRRDVARRVRLRIVNHTRSPLPPRGKLERAAALALAPLARRSKGRGLASSLVCVGAERMRRLNAEFAGRAELTDVLSFDEGEVDPDDGLYHVGEVVICRPVAVREARARGLTAKGEMLLYALHGWLHLAGHRDDTPRGRTRMVRAERRIMRSLGMPRDRRK